MTSASPAEGAAILRKLGWRPGFTMWCIGLPADIEALLAVPGATAEDPEPVVILGSVRVQADVEPVAAAALARYRRGARLWLAYPKRGTLPTDLSRDRGWAWIEAKGLLPVAQVAIDATWSALRFRYRDEIPRLTRKLRESGERPPVGASDR